VVHQPWHPGRTEPAVHPAVKLLVGARSVNRFDRRSLNSDSEEMDERGAALPAPYEPPRLHITRIGSAGSMMAIAWERQWAASAAHDRATS
jgi:hypothetical protein